MDPVLHTQLVEIVGELNVREAAKLESAFNILSTYATRRADRFEDSAFRQERERSKKLRAFATSCATLSFDAAARAEELADTGEEIRRCGHD